MENQGIVVEGRSRTADFITLTKPELTLLSVITAVGGFVLASGGGVFQFPQLAALVMGTLLIGGGVGSINQLIERKYDALMHRTETRPLPSGRLTPTEALLFGSGLCALGLLILLLLTNHLTALLGLSTLLIYLFAYTPLKRVTWIATLVGGIPGALPPVMGWTAVRNEVNVEAVVLFGILFFWQMPHFFSLAWMYRRDYARAGFRMLTVLDEDGSVTSRMILVYCLGLIPVSLLLSFVGPLGWIYSAGAILLGGVFAALALRLSFTRSVSDARRMFFASLIYLPALLAFMVVDLL